MKKKLFSTVILVSFLFSCVKEESFDVSESQNMTLYSYAFNASTEEDEPKGTRVSFDPANKTFEWNKGDKVMLLVSESDQGTPLETYKIFKQNKNNVIRYLPFVSSDDGARTSFSSEESTMELNETGKYNYKAIFPFPEQLSRESDPIAYSVATEQNGQFNQSECLMYAFLEDAPCLAEKPGGNSPTFTFHPMLTYLSFSILDLDKITASEEDFEIYGFEMEFPTAVAGEFTISPTDKNEKCLPFTMTREEKRLKVHLAVPIHATDRYDPLNSAIICCLPFSIRAGEQFTVKILARSAKYGNVSQKIVCAPGGGMDCLSGHFRKINLKLKTGSFKPEYITPVGGDSIQSLLGNPDFAPAVLPGNHKDIYNGNDYGWFVKAGKVMTAASRVLTIPTISGGSENVIILDNTVWSRWTTSPATQSSFMMPVETVLPDFYEPDFDKDLEVTFKANVLLSGNDVYYTSSEKVDAPIWVALNHCNESTSKGTDKGYRGIEKIMLPKENVTFSKKDICAEGYPAVGSNENPKPWVEYKTTISAKDLPLSEFVPNSDGTPAYIGFKIDDFNTTGNRMLIYLKDISFREVNRRKKISDSWMARVAGSTLLADLSIPGTHDAATGNLSNGSKRCQLLSLKEQMNIGVRALDLRPSASKDLMIYHSSTSTGVTFGDAIDDIATFLEANPSETIIAMVKNESGNDADWAKYMGAYLQENKDRKLSGGKKLFVDFKAGMTLDEARGSVILLSRNSYDGTVVGGMIDSSRWGDSTNESETTITAAKGGDSDKLLIQDNYLFTTSFDSKAKAIVSLLGKSGNDMNHLWYFNYVSISGTSPMENAVVMNYRILEHLQKNPGKTGVLWMDFAGQSYSMGNLLVKTVIDQNWKSN